MKTSAKYSEILEKANFYLIALIAFSQPFYRMIPVYLSCLWVITILLQGKFRERFTQKSKWQFFVLLLILAFYLLHAVGLLYTQNMKAGWFDLQVKLPILLMPLLMFGASDYLRKKSSSILHAFVAGNFLAAIICLIAATVRSFHFINGSWVFNAELLDHNYSFWQMLSNGGNNFMYDPLSIFHHPGYFSVYISFSALIVLEYIIRCWSKKKRSVRILLIILCIFFCIVVYLLFSRAGYLALFTGLTVLMIFHLFRSRYKWAFSGLLLIVLVAGFFAIKNNGRMQNSFDELSNFSSKTEQNISSDNRLLIWHNSLGIVKKHPGGVGVGDTKDELMKMYLEKQMIKAHDANLNVHNQFIETGVSLGFLGALLLLAVFICPIIYALKHRNILLLVFLLSTGIFFFFESALNNQAGSFYFAFILSVLLFVMHEKKELTMHSVS